MSDNYEIAVMKLLWREYIGAAGPVLPENKGENREWWENQTLADEILRNYPSTFQHYEDKHRIAWSKFTDYQMRKHSDAFRRFFSFSVT
jgi:hypothetical protein